MTVVAILGRLRIGGTTPTRRKTRLLIAALCLHANERVAEDDLIDLLWPAERPRDPLVSLRPHVSRARRALADLQADEPIMRSGDAYRLAVTDQELDAVAFSDLVRTADDGHPATATALLRAALDLWDGDILADVPELADHPRAVALSELRLHATERWAEATIESGGIGEVVTSLSPVCQAHPHRERLWAAHALALARSGNHAAALTACHRVADRLRDDLGLSPGPTIAAIEQGILHHNDELLRPHTRATVLSPLGPEPTEATNHGVPFVGRRDLLERLGMALACDATVVSVVGEPGSGKTRLLTHLVTTLGQERRWLWTQGLHWGPAPYSLVADLVTGALARIEPADRASLAGPQLAALALVVPALSELVPGLDTDPGLDVPGVEQRILAGLSGFLERLARGGPLTIVVDDAHGADEVSVTTLAGLVANGLPVGVSLLLTSRPVADPGAAPLAIVGAAGETTRTVTVSIGGLDQADVAELISVLGAEPVAGVDPDLVQLLVAETGGNPFFVTELVRHLVEEKWLVPVDGRWRLKPGVGSGDVPSSVVAVLGQRLAALPDAVQAVLEALAVMARPTSSAELADLVDQPRAMVNEALAVARRAGMVQQGPGPARFAHDLTGAAVVAAADPSRLRALHVTAARLAAHGSPSVFARHLSAAGDPTTPEHQRALVDAADEAMSHQAFRAAVSDYRRVIDARPSDPELILAAETGLIRAMAAIGDPEHRQVARSARERARALGGGQHLAQVAASLRATGWAGPVGTTDGLYDELLTEALASTELDPAKRPVLTADLAGSLLHTRQGERRVALYLDAERDAQAACSPSDYRRVLANCLVLDDRHLLDTMSNHARRLLALARGAGDEMATQLAHNIGMVAAFAAGDGQAIDAHALGLRRSAAVLRDPRAEWADRTWQASVALLRGRLDEAESLAGEALEFGMSRGVPVSRTMAMYGGQLIELRRVQGRLAELTGVADTLASDGAEFTTWDFGLALIAAQHRPAAEAGTIAADLAARAAGFTRGIGWSVEAVIVLDLAARGGRPDVARRVIEATDGYHHRPAFSGSASSGPLARWIGAAHNQLDDPVRAERLLLQGRGQAERLRAVVARAEVDVERAVTADRMGRREKARALAEAAASDAQRVGAFGVVSRAEHVLARV